MDQREQQLYELEKELEEAWFELQEAHLAPMSIRDYLGPEGRRYQEAVEQAARRYVLVLRRIAKLRAEK